MPPRNNCNRRRNVDGRFDLAVDSRQSTSAALLVLNLRSAISGLSLRGGTGYPAPHWNLELGTYVAQFHAASRLRNVDC